jgi:hypothetical protein
MLTSRINNLYSCLKPLFIVHRPFIDYETGDFKTGIHYWKPLSRTILDYMEHPEYKFEGDIGFLERKHIHADGVVYIGKEANNIDDQTLGVKRPQVFQNDNEIMHWILAIKLNDASKFGEDKSTLWRVQKRIKETGKLKRTEMVRRVSRFIYI